MRHKTIPLGANHIVAIIAFQEHLLSAGRFLHIGQTKVGPRRPTTGAAGRSPLAALRTSWPIGPVRERLRFSPIVIRRFVGCSGVEFLRQRASLGNVLFRRHNTQAAVQPRGSSPPASWIASLVTEAAIPCVFEQSLQQMGLLRAGG